MKPRTSIVIAVVAFAALVAVFALRGREWGSSTGPAKVAEGAHEAPTAPGAMPPRPAVLVTRPVQRVGATGKPRTLSPLMLDLARNRNFKEHYARLKALTSRTAEESYMLAQIIDQCGKVANRKKPASTDSYYNPDAERRFMESLPADQPQRARRIAAFEQINFNPCAGLEGIVSTEAEVRALLESAAAAGDPKARAQLIVRGVWDSILDPADPAQRGRLATISDSQLDSLKTVLASGDPRALVDAIEVFSLPLGNLTLQAGPSQVPMDYAAIYATLTLAACDLGYPCGPDSRYVLQWCAFNSQCDAATYPDHVFYYGLAPRPAQSVLEYEGALMRVIDGGDWSYFTFHRGPSPWLLPIR